MNLFTHVIISKILYRHLSCEIELNKSAFIYGNIKPDLTSKCLRNPHTLENYLITVCNSANSLMNEKISLKEYSIKLGEICHYTSDFFCLYHLNEEKFHHFKDHFIYELKLQFELLKMDYLNKLKIKLNMKKPEANISTIIKETRKEYFSYPATMQRDIICAFSSTIWICESVSYFLAFSTLVVEDEINPYSVLYFEGGKP